MTRRTITFDQAYLLTLEQQRQSTAAQIAFGRQLDLIEPRPGERILDLGCGSGVHSRFMAPRVAPGGLVVGVDSEREAIDLAKRLSEDRHADSLTFQVADAHHLPFEDESFDIVICISVLAFCEEPLQVLMEARRVLRPGGRLLLVNSDEDTRIFNGHDRELGRRVMRAIADRARDPWIGRRLAGLLTAAGFTIAREEVAAEVERRFTPDQAGYVMAHSLRDYLVGRTGLAEEEYERWLADLAACDEEGSYLYGRMQFTYLAAGRES